ncbi:hypothetical protein [Mycobacterium sp. URHB0021]
MQLAPDALGPSYYQELIPDSGTWVPQPGALVGASDKLPEFPIDVRDLVQVPEGQLAPFDTKQMAPGLWYRPPHPR